ncbi:MAG: alpha/beta fold hydrolase [Burkholderiaceae bacterium]|nr:alpha/beta fold hydrolase [Burkholderiaceae bacterium]
MNYAEKRSIHIHYEIFGDESGIPLLLVMGLGMPLKAWPKLFIQSLVREGFRVIVFDNRDSGKSTQISHDVRPMDVVEAIFKALTRQKVTSAYTLEDMADDALSVLDSLGIARAHVLGISMGGMIGQVLASRHPHRLSSLTSIMSASGNPRTGVGKLRALKGLLTKPENAFDVKSLRDYLKKMFRLIGSEEMGYSDVQIQEIAQYMVDNHYQPQATSRQLLAILASGDRRSQLKHITVPTLVIHGQDDPLLPIEAGKEVADLIPGARLMVVPRMGHDLPTSSIELFVKEVSSHCRNHRY